MPTSIHLFVNTINTVSRRWIHSIPYSIVNIIFSSAHAICGTSSHRDWRNIVKTANEAINSTSSMTEDKKGVYYLFLDFSKEILFNIRINLLFTIFVIFEIRISCSLRILFFKSNFASNQDYGKWNFTHSQLMSTNTRDDKNEFNIKRGWCLVNGKWMPIDLTEIFLIN